jgi:hypothetical protein
VYFWLKASTKGDLYPVATPGGSQTSTIASGLGTRHGPAQLQPVSFAPRLRNVTLAHAECQEESEPIEHKTGGEVLALRATLSDNTLGCRARPQPISHDSYDIFTWRTLVRVSHGCTEIRRHRAPFVLPGMALKVARPEQMGTARGEEDGTTAACSAEL